MKLWSAPAFSLFIIPNIIQVFLTFFGSVLGDFPASDQPSLLLCALRCPWYHLRYWVFDEWYSDSFSMFIIPDVIRGLSHILQFSARGFPREFPYLYKKNKHHRCINPKTDRLRSPITYFSVGTMCRPLNSSNASGTPNKRLLSNPQLLPRGAVRRTEVSVTPKVNQDIVCLRKIGVSITNPERPSNGMEGAASA